MFQWPGEKYGYLLVCLSLGECGVFVTIVPWLLHSLEAGDRIKKQNKKRRKGKKKKINRKPGMSKSTWPSTNPRIQITVSARGIPWSVARVHDTAYVHSNSKHTYV